MSYRLAGQTAGDRWGIVVDGRNNGEYPILVSGQELALLIVRLLNDHANLTTTYSTYRRDNEVQRLLAAINRRRCGRGHQRAPEYVEDAAEEDKTHDIGGSG